MAVSGAWRAGGGDLNPVELPTTHEGWRRKVAEGCQDRAEMYRGMWVQAQSALLEANHHIEHLERELRLAESEIESLSSDLRDAERELEHEV